MGLLAIDMRQSHLTAQSLRGVGKEKVAFEGKEVDVVKLVRENKDRFVLKPNEGYGGFGIVVGRDADQKAWEQAIDKALTPPADYAVQEFVDIPVERFPVMEGDQLKGFEEKNVNINFWSHDGEFAGAFLRASSGTLINVHQGGGLVPVFFVEEK
jgi:uncharacterized circularly permuted ATP-grasp superfamily protein